MSSSPIQSSRKRRRSPSNVHLGAGPSFQGNESDAGTPAALAASTPGALSARSSSPPPSSLPPSSPPAAFSDMTDGEEDGEDGVIDDEDDAERLGQAYEEDEDVEGEDLFGEGMEGDYTGNAALDQYDQGLGLNDEEEFDALDDSTRRFAELKMQRRDRAEGKGSYGQRSRAPNFLGENDDDDEFEEDELMRRRRRRHYDEYVQAEEEEEEIPLDQLAQARTDSLESWIALEPVRKSIMREFKNFLVTCVDAVGNSVYGPRASMVGERNLQTFEVSFNDLVDSKATLAFLLTNCPASMLPLFDVVAFDVVHLYYGEFHRIHEEVYVRITDFPSVQEIRDLRQVHLNTLVRVQGVVTRRSGVFPQMKYVKFDCKKCATVLGPFFQEESKEVKVSFCHNCQSKGPFQINTEQTVYRNYQKMTLQESPGSVPPGRLPRHREVILLYDLIDSAKPGEEVEVTGIYRNNFDASLNTKNGFPVFATILEANHIAKRDDAYAAFHLTSEDESAIKALSNDPNIGKRIIKSMAPSIYGHDDIKTAMALSLFGGVAKDVGGKHRIRGDINVLLLGDPGTAKSQFLKYVEKTASRAIFTTGQGASAVGLTASVRKDPMTGEWTLEGGALVLADKGVCLIDEFDKMNDADRTSIHEAMEQQSISISKAGIITTLQARCAIIAAANPIRGRYNSTIPFTQNVELTEPILSRFDILCVVKDTVDPIKDDLLARFVVGSHTRSHPAFDEERDEVHVATFLDADIIPQDLLKKYIMYARTHMRPQLGSLDQDRMARLYADLRRESLSTGSYPITVRHLESMIRMAEASAKMHLREHVRKDDIDLAIRATIESFVSAQKMSVKKTLERGFRKYLNQERDQHELLAFLLGGIIKDRMRFTHLGKQQRRQQAETVEGRGGGGEEDESGREIITVPLTELETRSKEMGVFDLQDFLNSRLFRTNGYTFNERNRTISKAFGARTGREEL
ncbi:hypothetical protein CBS101457_004014 [Exobasidium rhododendri]|nr:hypothetical protein CBS101457_004014 [Exobasidium rhododendri]